MPLHCPSTVGSAHHWLEQGRHNCSDSFLAHFLPCELCVGSDLVGWQVAALKKIVDLTSVSDEFAEKMLSQVGENSIFSTVEAAIRYIAVTRVMTRANVSERAAVDALEDCGDSVGEYGPVSEAIDLIRSDQ